MTTLAFKDGVLASDKKMSYHSSTVLKQWKIEKGPFVGWLFAGSGTGAVVRQMKDWIEGDLEELALPNDYQGAAMLIDPEGNISLYINESLYPSPIEESFFSVGSGSDYAMGAMAMGASAEEAIVIASKYDPGTGNGVDLLYL